MEFHYHAFCAPEVNPPLKRYDLHLQILVNEFELETSLLGAHCIGSGTKKEHKPKLLSPDIFRWGRGLPREGVGAKKFGTSLETGEIKLFLRDIPGFCRDIPGVPEKFEEKKCGFNFRSL